MQSSNMKISVSTLDVGKKPESNDVNILYFGSCLQ